mgnify:CR=1 FL=1
MNWKKIGFDCIRKAISALNSLTEVKAINNKINIQTNADILSNNIILKTLANHNVSCNVFSEEENKVIRINDGDKKVQVILDPIDNTYLFLRGEKSFCSVAMMILINNKPAYSFVGDILTNDIYYCDQKKAYSNK